MVSYSYSILEVQFESQKGKVGGEKAVVLLTAEQDIVSYHFGPSLISSNLIKDKHHLSQWLLLNNISLGKRDVKIS